MRYVRSSWRLVGLLVGSVLLAGSPPSAAQDAGLSGQIERLTRGLLGGEYRLSPLGEGHPPDPDPRLRYDAFDCTTFVETAFALALSEGAETEGSPGDVEEWLDRIRYQGPGREFADRRHLVVAQWLPGLQRLGLLEEATDEVAGEEMPRVLLDLDLERWQGRSVAGELVLPEDRVPVGHWELPYVPLERSARVLLAGPSGLLINVVRVPSSRAPIVVTHQALLLERDQGVRVVRHASGRYGRVVDQSVEEFVRDLERPHSWPIAGLNLQRLVLQPLDPPSPGRAGSPAPQSVDRAGAVPPG